MKLNLIAIILALFISSCSVLSPNKSGCGTERDVMRHDAKPFRVMKLKEGGTIAKATQHRRTTLVSVKRTMRGWKNLFVADQGDTIVTYSSERYTAGECFLIITI